MIIDDITLHNFGAYRGRHTAILTPPDKARPLVLIGGLNGGGKTTLLDALQLVLYGKLARCSNFNGITYDEFLRRCINRAGDLTEGAAVQLTFRRRTDGHEHTYRIHRSWVPNGSGVKERIEVIRDGVLDPVATSSWDELVHEILPARLSQLFFFDGDRIEALADLDNSSQLLATAIQSLLGLDHVDRLARDLVVLEKRKRTNQKPESERQAISQLGEELAAVESRRRDLVDERAAVQNELDRSEVKCRELDDQFRLEGGDRFQRREQCEAERAGKEQQLTKVEHELRELMSGLLPLIQLRGLVHDAQGQAAKEFQACQARAVVDLLTQRDVALLKLLRSAKAPTAIREATELFLEKDRSKRKRAARTAEYLNLSAEGYRFLGSLPSELELSRRHAERLVGLSEALQRDLVNLDRTLEGVPDGAILENLAKRREAARLRLIEIRGRLAAIDDTLERTEREYQQKQASLVSQIESTVGEDFKHEDTRRLITHSERVRSTLGAFRAAVLGQHLSQIERFVLESLTTLLHKRSLISAIRINPELFTIELFDSTRHRILPERLSAGERQLLAVSLLWGLARASGHALPAIIDTPLGRLDAEHRSHLVERYFPHASHQVVLLSTDEEIDQQHYARLKPWIGRSYRLAFDDRTGCTSIQQGYFW